MINGILWKLRTGAPWRNLPERYGPWETPRKRPDMLIADKGYAHDSTRRALRRRSIRHTIPERADQIARRVAKGQADGRPPAFDAAVYKRRNVVERCFNRLKQWRDLAIRYATGDAEKDLPKIYFDLWFDVDDDNLHRVIDLLPGLDWNGEPVGVRMVYAPRDPSALMANYREARNGAKLPEGKSDASYKHWPGTSLTI